MKPLYLNGRTKLAVALDGAALRIADGEAADALVPLGRLSRIVSRGRVEWSSEAMTACLQRGIAISLVSLSGSYVGICLGSRVRNMTLGQRLDELPGDRRGLDLYTGWVRSRERAAIRAVLKRLDLPAPEDLRPAVIWEGLRRRHGAGNPVLNDLVPQLDGLAHAHVVALVGHEVGSRFIAGQMRPLDLAADFHRILRWEIWPALPRAAAYVADHERKVRPARARDAWAVRLCETLSPRTEKLFRRERARLEAMLAGEP